MSKKAKEVVEAAPKFTQPWQGFLSFGVIMLMAYITLQWFIHPVWGLFTKMVQSNAYIVFNYFSVLGRADLGLTFALNNPLNMEIYPLGYLVNWVPYFIFCIMWFVSIAFLARPFTPSKSRISKQPWMGLIVLVLTMILAFITWYILAMVFKMRGYEMIVLGTCGFFIFPIWVTLFNYWPFIPKRPQTHAIIRGAILITLSWVITIFIRWIVAGRMWGNSLAVVGTQYALAGPWASYLFTYPLTLLTPTEPYDFWISIILSLIVATTLISAIGPFPNMKQPLRGLVNFILAIILGLIMWGIIVAILGPSSQTILTTAPAGIPWLFTFPYINHGAVAAYLAFPLVTLLFGQLTFGMWPWAKWGMKGNLIWVIMAFIIGTIIYYIMMVNPGFASALTGGNLIVPTSGLGSIYQYFWLAGLLSGGVPIIVLNEYVAFALYFEGLGTFVGHALLFAWILTVVIFYLLAYEAFEHWPWK